jgi:hypothetical protein
MNIETKRNFKPPKPQANRVSDLLRKLMPGAVLRINTAAEMRNSMGAIQAVQKSRGIKFGTVVEGDDVLVFVKS